MTAITGSIFRGRNTRLTAVTTLTSDDNQTCTMFSEDGTYNGFETLEQNWQHEYFRKIHQ